jgi:hypothetical protein
MPRARATGSKPSTFSTSKSFRATHLRDVIAHESNEAILQGAVLQGNLTKELQLLISESTKQTLVNGKREPVTSYLGNLDAIAFTADDLAVIGALQMHGADSSIAASSEYILPISGHWLVTTGRSSRRTACSGCRRGGPDVGEDEGVRIAR